MPEEVGEALAEAKTLRAPALQYAPKGMFSNFQMQLLACPAVSDVQPPCPRR